MPGETPLFDEPQLLTPSRDWARRRYAAKDLSWIGPSFIEPAEPLRYTRAPAVNGTPVRFCGILSAFATAPSLKEAARIAHLEGRPSAWEGLDLLFLPVELAVETRDAWWRLGTRPDVARTLLRAFGLDDVVAADDEPLVEQVLAWLPDYVAGRGLGDYARRLLRLLDSVEADRWAHLPGETETATTVLDETSQQQLDDGEILGVRALSWFAGRAPASDEPPADLCDGRTLHLRGGAVRATGKAPLLRPEDALLHLEPDAPVDPAVFRVVPPWTQARFMPPARQETP